MSNKDGINGCLRCGNTKAKLKRGLCETHYSQYWRSLQRVPKDLQDQFTDRLIELGVLLAKKPPGAQTKDDIYAEIAQEFSIAAESKSDYEAMKEEIEQLTEEEFKPAVERAKKKVTKKKSTPQKSNQKRKSQ